MNPLKTAQLYGWIMLAMLASTTIAQAEDYTYTTNSGSITITGYTGTGGAVSIPETINGLPVAAIGNDAFYQNENMTSVTVPDSVLDIGDWAFSWCGGLASIIIGNGVTNVGDSAFSESGLTNITFGSGLENLGAQAFFFCFSLEGVYFYGNAPSLGDELVFGNCDNATAYYLEGTTGWGATLGGIPTALWNPPANNLLINPSFDTDLTGWTTDAGFPRLLSDISRAYSGDMLFYFSGSVAGQIHQDVDLLAAGYFQANIDAGLHAVVFGGWQNSHEELDLGQISVVFLDASQQELGTASLLAVSPANWTGYSATNPIPAQTTTLRYTFTGEQVSGGNLIDVNSYLDDAILEVLLDVPVADVTLTIESQYGTPMPSVGIHTNAYGATVACSVASVASGDTEFESIGWSLTGNEPASGTTNSFDLTITNNATLTWNWQTNYWLDVNVTGSGSVDVSDGFFAKGSEQILTATPDAGWLFMGWSGDASGTNEAFVMMTEPKTVMANFSDDADGDGLTNTEEAGLGSNPWNSDTDGDGFDDFFEVGKGLSPTNDDSDVAVYIQNHDSSFGLYPSNVVLDVAMGEVLLDIVGNEASLNLQLKISDDLITWTDAGSTNVWNWTVGEEKKFFRVRSGK